MDIKSTRILTPVTRLLVASALGLLLCAPPAAHSESNRIREARSWLKRGVAAMRAGELREALVAYEAADRYDPNPKHKMMVAKIYEMIGGHQGCLRAITLWKLIAGELSDGSPLHTRTTDKLSKLRKHCLRTITIQTRPSGAKIWVDQQLTGFSPLVLQAIVEPLRITAELRGQRQQQTLISEQTEALLVFKDIAHDPYAHAPQLASEHRERSTSHSIGSTAKRPIHFNAELTCQTQLSESAEPLRHCQSRLLWEGDQFKFKFRSDQPVYLYVFLQNDLGQQQTLFPRGNARNRIPAHVVVTLPNQSWFDLDALGPTQERITVIYARHPVPEFESIRKLDLTPREVQRRLQTFAMRSLRGVSFQGGAAPTLSVVDALDEQSAFIGRHDINSVDFTLLHQGARPK